MDREHERTVDGGHNDGLMVFSLFLFFVGIKSQEQLAKETRRKNNDGHNFFIIKIVTF
jgi:hypothetical protein